MKNYCVKEQVNWREIMSIQRWFLLMRKNAFEDVYLSSDVPSQYIEREKKYLREDLELYQSLRRFLRNPNPARIELEIEELLETAPRQKEPALTEPPPFL